MQTGQFKAMSTMIGIGIKKHVAARDLNEIWGLIREY